MKIRFVFISLLLSVFCTSGAVSAGARRPASGTVRMPKVTTAGLGNGVRLFYIRDELPQITILASVGFGKLYENKNSAGISELIAKTISLAGSKKYPSAALHESIDSMGGRLSVDASWEHTVISIKVLERFKKEAFAIMADLIRNPNFDPRYFTMAKALLSDSLRRKYEDPAETAFGKAREIIFGGDGYGSYPTPESINLLTLDQAQEAWHRYFCGRNIMIGIYASLPASEIDKLFAGSFSSISAGSMQQYAVDKRKIADALQGSNNTIFFYPRDIPQSTIIVGSAAPDIGYPGNYPLEIMNYVLGGGSFNSRLVAEIRVKRGLAYAVQSVIRFRYKTGVFLAYAQTENRTAGRVLAIMKENIEKLGRESMHRNEIVWAKNAISNSFIFQFDTPHNILSNYMEIAYNNLPVDYYARYLDHIRAVQETDIVREAGELFRYGTITVVVGGEAAAAGLAKFGKVVVIKN
ncbi:MAG: hypothetical protein A2W19_16085 [Spirochaetes bacterium RBG_16_49_21]|nr:MAG: hypothetical protein A2W19_16085 [Spirochaetes bacterium RBG_16_49_21]